MASSASAGHEERPALANQHVDRGEEVSGDLASRSPPDPRARPAVKGSTLAALALVAFGLSIVATGYSVFTDNQCFQIPLIKRLNDPGLYAGDPFVGTLDRYASMVWPVVALVARIVPTAPLLLALFLLERALLFAGVAYVARGLAPNSRLVPIGLLAYFALAPHAPIGAGTIVTHYFEQTGVSIAFFLLAFGAFVRQRPVLTALALAAGFNANSMYGTFTLTYLGLAFVAMPAPRAAWRSWTRAFILFLFGASPAIVATIRAAAPGSYDAALWLGAARVRLPYHLFPSTFPLIAFAELAVFAAMTTLSVWWTRRSRPDLVRLAGALLVVAAGWVGFSFAAAYVFHSPVLIVTHAARAVDVYLCFVASTAIAALACHLEAGGGRKGMAFAALMGIVCFAPILAWLPFVVIALVVLLAVAIEALAWRGPLGRGAPVRLAVVVSVIAALLGVNMALQRRGSDHGWLLARKPDPERNLIGAWARDRTDKDATFLVNPEWGDFRIFAARPVFVSWEDGSAILWDRPYVAVWVERLRALGVDPLASPIPEDGIEREVERRYAALGDDDVAALARRDHLRYWIAPARQISRFPVAFATPRQQVLRLP